MWNGLQRYVKLINIQTLPLAGFVNIIATWLGTFVLYSTLIYAFGLWGGWSAIKMDYMRLGRCQLDYVADVRNDKCTQHFDWE